MNTLSLCIVVLISGIVVAAQTAVNRKLGIQIDKPFYAVLISFTVGTIGTILICLFKGDELPDKEKLTSGPWWMWIGGLLGVIYVATSVIAAAKLQVTITLVLIVGGQLVGALIIDNFGLLGTTPREVSWQRVLGCILALSGAALVAWQSE